MSDTYLDDVDQAEPELAPDVADFDAFFAEQDTARPRAELVLYSRRYTLPDSLPLMFTLQMERLQSSEDPDDVRAILRTLVGVDALDHWAEQGMTDRQLGVVLIWAAANVRTPGSVSMARASELHDQQSTAKAQGKAQAAPAPQNREQRRAKQGTKRKQPGGSGRRS
ncbi:hypothetical protein OHV05_15410 [Kitasatospora sp. NBC_00070]|uniref:hypothetical protein n=1 Tax=Kitasatospora sp. NBC_00070 TaxID=2975962 RepID=UPI00324ACDEB